MHWRWAALGAFAFIAMESPSFASNGSNYLQLLNGVDVFYGGKYNPPHPSGTMGVWRCIPADTMHAPTMTIDPVGTVPPGKYAYKIQRLNFTACASSGASAMWPTLALSSSDGDCRLTGGTGSGLNFGFVSTMPFFGTGGWGHVAFGPLNSSSGTVNLLALVGGTQFAGPFQAGPTGALVYGIDLNLIWESPSTIAVPEGESLTYWISESLTQGPGNYMYWTASEDERSVCSSMSAIASAIGTPNGAVLRVPPNREFGMFVSTLDAAMTAAVAPTAFDVGLPNTTMAAATGGVNPMDTGTGARTLSLTGQTPEGGNGLGFETLSFNTFAERSFSDPHIGGGILVFANLMAFNSLGSPSCGPWSPGYVPLASGGPGGPVLSTKIPQRPRIVGKLDAVTLALIANPAWILSTLHDLDDAGAEYPMFPGFTVRGGSTGNTGGFAIPVPNLPSLVGVEMFFSGVHLTAGNTSIARTSNEGHWHTNGFATTFFP